jgi:hypothetical protein
MEISVIGPTLVCPHIALPWVKIRENRKRRQNALYQRCNKYTILGCDGDKTIRDKERSGRMDEGNRPRSVIGQENG